MRSAPSVFLSRSGDAAELLASLRAAGFSVDASTPVTFTVLDTIDGRLQRKGLRLVATCTGTTPTVTLDLSMAGALHHSITTDGIPLRASELHSGELCEAIQAVTGERVLLAQTTIVATRTLPTKRSPSGELRALLTVDDGLSLAGSRKSLVSSATVHRVAGHGKSRRSAEALCIEAGFAASSDDVLDVALRAAGVDLRGVSRSPGDEFDDDTTALDGLRSVFAQLLIEIEAYWQGAAEGRDAAFVHGLRVAVRRSRSLLAEGKSVMPRAVFTTASHGLAALGACTGPARDLDVYLAEWASYTSLLDEDAIAALDPLKVYLEARRHIAYDELATALSIPETKVFVRDWSRWVRRPVPSRSTQGSPDGARGLAEFVVERIERAHLTLLHNGRLITDASPATQLHDLRRDAKRLRYLLECFSALLPGKPTRSFVRRLKILQDNLGAHQDAEVHAAQTVALVLHHEALDWPEATVAATGELARQMEQQCHAARAEFSASFAEYDSPATQAALRSLSRTVR